MFSLRLPTINYVESSSRWLGGFAGRSFLWMVWIDKAYKNDTGLYQHEYTHFKQWKRSKLLHPLRYQFSATYRYNMELKAYKAQLVYSVDRARDSELFSEFIINRYRLDSLVLTIKFIKKELLS